jgi:phosphatidylglycerophosphatase A
VVFDEIAAIPVCFIGWMLIGRTKAPLPTPVYFFQSHLFPAIGIFIAFRLFDIWKPWPVRQSQSLPGGWGVTVDDALAAVYVNVVVLLFLFCWGGL